MSNCHICHTKGLAKCFIQHIVATFPPIAFVIQYTRSERCHNNKYHIWHPSAAETMIETNYLSNWRILVITSVISIIIWHMFLFQYPCKLGNLFCQPFIKVAIGWVTHGMHSVELKFYPLRPLNLSGMSVQVVIRNEQTDCDNKSLITNYLRIERNYAYNASKNFKFPC